MFDTTSSNASKQFFTLLTNRWALGCFSMLIIQQLIDATSTLWLVKLMEAITSGQTFFPFLALFLASVVVPYIPQCLAYILRISWKQEAQRSFISAFVKNNRNNLGDWGNKGLKEQKMSILNSEGPAALNALIDYVFDFNVYALSVFFNIIVMSIVVEPLFAIAFAISMAGVIVVMTIRRRAQRQLTLKALTARIELGQSLLAAWDNVLIGNEYNFNLWEEKTNQRLNRCLQRNVDLERFDQTMSIFVSLMTFVPALCVVIYFAIKHQNDTVHLSAFVITLPTLFTILSYTYQTLSLAFRWGMHRSKLASIFRAIQGSKEAQKHLEKKVKWPKIHMTDTTVAPNHQVSLAGPQPLKSHADILNQASHSGRLTLRGENGSGKSTALTLVKSALADRAFLLPTHTQLIFNAEDNKHSTGESLKNRLLEILERVDVDVLLLDEWDANLDKENQERLSQLIDMLAEKKCVVEVRHR